MSENTQKVIVVANLKSPVVGFVLALFLGWLGVDRFYKGGVLSIFAWDYQIDIWCDACIFRFNSYGWFWLATSCICIGCGQRFATSY